jgi:hypothetical protein
MAYASTPPSTYNLNIIGMMVMCSRPCQVWFHGTAAANLIEIDGRPEDPLLMKKAMELAKIQTCVTTDAVNEPTEHE